MKRKRIFIPEKPKALVAGSRIGLVAPSSPADRIDVLAGMAELERLGFVVDEPRPHGVSGFFAGSLEERLQGFCRTVHDKNVDGVVAMRGGYGANYLLDARLTTRLLGPKCLVGFSDFTSIQATLTGIRGWVTFYGPMAAAGFHRGEGRPHGYDEESFLEAVTRTGGKWKLKLHGESLREGAASGRLIGGCLTLLQTTLGTAWEIETDGAILLLEDSGMKPYQVDRALMHLKLAGKLARVNAIVLGEFPGCEPVVSGSPTVHEVCERILRELRIPIVYGAPVGHTPRPMLTVPLGVKAQLVAKGEGTLEILEPAVK